MYIHVRWVAALCYNNCSIAIHPSISRRSSASSSPPAHARCMTCRRERRPGPLAGWALADHWWEWLQPFLYVLDSSQDMRWFTTVTLCSDSQHHHSVAIKRTWNYVCSLLIGIGPRELAHSTSPRWPSLASRDFRFGGLPHLDDARSGQLYCGTVRPGLKRWWWWWWSNLSHCWESTSECWHMHNYIAASHHHHHKDS